VGEGDPWGGECTLDLSPGSCPRDLWEATCEDRRLTAADRCPAQWFSSCFSDFPFMFEGNLHPVTGVQTSSRRYHRAYMSICWLPTRLNVQWATRTASVQTSAGPVTPPDLGHPFLTCWHHRGPRGNGQRALPLVSPQGCERYLPCNALALNTSVALVVLVINRCFRHCCCECSHVTSLYSLES
jgi:hypothetical protein